MVMTIPAVSFTPVPKVDSALVILEVRDEPAVEVDDMARFFRFVEAVFQFRRKQLGGTLGRLTRTPNVEAIEVLSGLGIEPTRRPQTLTLPEWETVFRAFNSRFDR
jgi:16S rRNA (adenine1518-N6/adenine1519-N6)-dimethyltransferase